MQKKTKTAVRDWLAINLGLFTGLRVEEMSQLLHKDIITQGTNASLFIRRGKNNKPRIIKFGTKFKEIIKEYTAWKKNAGEPCEADDPLIYSSNSKKAMTTRGIQKIFERSAKRAGITGHSIHHLRHTYASHLYKASGYNLRMVQKQLGHSSIRTTEVYADVLRPDLDRALSRLYGK